MQQFYNQATLIAIYSIYAISLNVLLGYTGQLSVAHAAFGAVGGYIAAYLGLDHGWSFIPCLLIGGAGACKTSSPKTRPISPACWPACRRPTWTSAT